MRILMDLQTLDTPEKQRGIGLAVRSLAAELLLTTHEHCFFLARKRDSGWEVAAADSRSASLDGLWDDPAHWTLATPEAFMASAQIDTIYITSPMMPDIDMLPIPAGVRVACQVHDLIPLVMAEQYLNRWPPPLQADYQRRLSSVGHADLLLCDSKATANDLARLLHPQGTVAVTYLGPTARFFPMDRDIARQVVATELGQAAPFILAVSGWDARKNNPGIMGGFAASGLPQHRLMLAGFRGRNHAELDALAAAYGVADRLVHVPFVSPEILNACYAAADLTLFPSLYEGFGLPVLESLLSGTPVVAGNTSSLSEVVGNGGILVDPNEHRAIGAAVQRIVRDDGLRASLSTSGRQHAAQFTWSAAAHRVRCALATLSP